MRAIITISNIAVKELIHERVFYVLLSFVIFGLGLSTLLAQMTFVERAKLTLDFGLAGIQLTMVLFSVFVGIFLLQREMHQGSVYLVLSKPIRRSSFLIGKYVGQSLVQGIVIVTMGLLLSFLLLTAKPEASLVPLWQSVWFIFIEVSIVTAVTYVFSVLAGGLTAAVATLSVFFLGHSRELIESYLNRQGDTGWVWSLVKGIIPYFEILDLKSMAAYEHITEMTTMGWGSAYGLITLSFFLIIACACFQRKDILY